MAFDYKKEYKELYAPSKKPSIIEVPSMNFIAVRGKGDPNSENSEYKRSLELLYPLAYTIKMSKMGDHRIDGYFDFVVPPLEGFWWQDDTIGAIDYTNKDAFNFISCIRLPDFVTKEEFDWAIDEATKKKGKDFSEVEFITLDEGLCVQCLHVGCYDSEPSTIEKMDAYIESLGRSLDFRDGRLHHEIYLSDPRKCAPERLKTVIRQPIR